jgi:adenosylcobinamide kinase/adenosylcobinamide-phosphate guanylyltransferase
VIAGATGPVLVDCLGTWLTGVIDERGLWEAPSEEAAGAVDGLLDRLVDALAAAAVDVVLVTNEVGLGVVPAHRSGRLFRDLLGTVNQRVAAVCDEVHLVVAGRVLRL